MEVYRTYPLIRLFLFCLLLAAGCRERNQTATPANEIARVGNASINRDAFQALLNQRSGGDSTRFATIAAKEALLDELVRREAILAKAKAAGFDQRPDVQESIKRLITSKFQEEKMKPQESAEPAVSEDEVQQYYEQHATQYAAPAKVRGAIIFLKMSPQTTAENRQLVMAKAQALLDEAKAAVPGDFARLVEANSEDQTTRYRAGDIGWLTREAKIWELDPAVTEALFSVQKTGDFAPLVATKRGVYIVKLLDAQPAGVRPLKEVKDRIVYTVRKQKKEQREQDFFAEMKAGLDVRVNRPVLESIQPPSSLPAMLPATPGTIAQK